MAESSSPETPKSPAPATPQSADSKDDTDEVDAIVENSTDTSGEAETTAESASSQASANTTEPKEERYEPRRRNPSEPVYTPPPEPPPSRLPSVAAVVVLTWVLPGSGYLLINQRARGITIGSVILILFFLGLLIGGITVIDTPSDFADLGAKPWFIGQALSGPVSLLCAWIANHVAVQSHARSFEIGTLYTAVAGMLNLLAMIDVGARTASMGAA
jgi:hypothetical protein